MKLRGFTLAEVLIVIAILGVIAALTLPAINSNIQKQQMGPALMRAISTLDTANALVAQEHDFYNFAESCQNYLNDCFEPFVKEKLGAAKFDEDIVYGEFHNYNAEHRYPNGYTTQNGFIYYIPNENFYDPVRIDVLVDVNGNKRPNAIGKDLFILNLVPEDEGSRLYAVGSNAWSEKFEPDATWKNGGCDKTSVHDEKTCGGSIVDNGGRIIYPWN